MKLAYLKDRWRSYSIFEKSLLIVASGLIGGILIGALIDEISPTSREARKLGFRSPSDLNDAKKAGFTDPVLWHAKQRAEWAAIAKRNQEDKDERIEARDADCKSDLQCWAGRGLLDAGNYCKRRIATISEYDHRWTDGWNESKFSRYMWSDQNKGIVTYIGDKIQIQNEYGAYRNHTYRCDFDPRSKTVSKVSLEAGRLD